MIDSFLNIELRGRLSRFRKPSMGFAILWIFMLHSGRTGNPVWDAIRSNSWIGGWAGVDIFFFLSAIGLCYSLNKNSNIRDFYMRRAIRILPTWLFVLFLVHFAGLACNHFLPDLPFYVPDSVAKCVTWYTGIGFWISSFVFGNGWFYEWYVPSLIVFYIVTPFLYRKSNIALTILFLFFFVIGYLLNQFNLLKEIHFFYNRIPVFILGIITYRIIKESNKLFNVYLAACLLLGITCLVINTTLLVLPKEYVALFLCPPFLIILSFIFEFKYINDFFSFFGGISLELYLIHLYRRPHFLISFFSDNKYVTIFTALLVCTFAAVMLKHIMDNVLMRFKRGK